MELYQLYQMLFYGGIVSMGAAAAAAVIAAVVLVISGKRLRAQLEREYGPQRRRK